MAKVANSGNELGAQNDIYKKEMEFYCKIVPQFKKGLERLHDISQIVPEIFGACETNMMILMEDLSAKSYGIASVYQGLDLKEAQIVLKKAAKFHAINAFLQQENENIFENFKYGKKNCIQFDTKRSNQRVKWASLAHQTGSQYNSANFECCTKSLLEIKNYHASFYITLRSKDVKFDIFREKELLDNALCGSKNFSSFYALIQMIKI